jgi:hypothetical protein
MPQEKLINGKTQETSKKTEHRIIILFTIVAVAIISFLLYGCGEPPEQAIRRAISYDKAITKQIYKDPSIGEALFGANPERDASLVRNLKKVPLENCPKDFQMAYKKHIAAWEARNKSQIRSTWNDVLATAKLYGVNDE